MRGKMKQRRLLQAVKQRFFSRGQSLKLRIRRRRKAGEDCHLETKKEKQSESTQRAAITHFL